MGTDPEGILGQTVIRPVQTIVKFAHTEPCDAISVDVVVTFAVRDLEGKRTGLGFKWSKTASPEKIVTVADCEEAAQAYADSLGGGSIEAIVLPEETKDDD